MKSKRTQLLSLLLLPALCAQALSQAPPARKPSDEVRRASAALAGSVLVGGRAWDYLKGLADGFGARLSGSPAYERSAEWAAGQFRAAGVKDVRLEEWEMESTWQRGTEARGRIVAPVERRLSVESLGWSPSTPAGGVRGDVLLVSDIRPEAIRSQAARIKGKVVLLDVGRLFAENVWKAYQLVIASQPVLKEAGALALILPETTANNAHNATSLNWGSALAPLPEAQFGM